MGASWAFLRVSWDPFGGLLGPLGATWGRLGEFLGPSLGILRGILDDKAPKMLLRRHKEPPRGSKRLPKGLQKTSRTPPRGRRTRPKDHRKSKRKQHLNYLIVVVWPRLFINFGLTVFVLYVATWLTNFEISNVLVIKKPGSAE